MALVIVGHRLVVPGLDRQSALRAVERLNPTFFIDRQHHGVGRRIDPRVQPEINYEVSIPPPSDPG